MAELKIKLVIDPKAVMTGFCWADCNALLEKLKELFEKGELFECEMGKAIKKEKEFGEFGYSSELTEISFAVISALKTQVDFVGLDSNDAQPTAVAALIAVCEEFLDIYRQKEVIAEEPDPETIEQRIRQVSLAKFEGDIAEIIYNNPRIDSAVIEIRKLLQEKYKLL